MLSKKGWIFVEIIGEKKVFKQHFFYSKIMKKVIKTEMFNVDFYYKFTKSGSFCFFLLFSYSRIQFPYLFLY